MMKLICQASYISKEFRIGRGEAEGAVSRNVISQVQQSSALARGASLVTSARHPQSIDHPRESSSAANIARTCFRVARKEELRKRWIA